MQVKIVTSSSDHCNPTKINNVTLFQILYNNESISGHMLVVGVSYQINGAFQLFLKNSNGQTTFFSDQYSGNKLIFSGFDLLVI